MIHHKSMLGCGTTAGAEFQVSSRKAVDWIDEQKNERHECCPNRYGVSESPPLASTYTSTLHKRSNIVAPDTWRTEETR